MGGQGYARHQGRVRIVFSGPCPLERVLLELTMGECSILVQTRVQKCDLRDVVVLSHPEVLQVSTSRLEYPQLTSIIMLAHLIA